MNRNDLTKNIAELKEKPLDFFDGAMIRSDELADFLEYQPSLMLKSIETKKRIPDDRLPWKELVWW